MKPCRLAVVRKASLSRARALRTVVIGDLNGADDALRDILRGTRLIDGRDRWIGGRAELVQMGDLFNRGGGAREALRLLQALTRPARAAGGRVTVLLGNHEVMTALGNESYCTEAEYLSFASAAARRAWPKRVEKAARRLYRKASPSGHFLPFEPRLEAWKALHAPGRAELRRALGPRSPLGKVLRSLPVAYASADVVFVHGGISPNWAALGIDGLNDAAQAAWNERPRRYRHLSKKSLLRSNDGPLWDRSLVRPGRQTAARLGKSLRLLGARRMVIGHTQTKSVRGGEPGRILTLHEDRLVLVDVGLEHGPESPRAALVIEGKRGFEWRPDGTRLLWRDE
jgi:hypothetical protein